MTLITGHSHHFLLLTASFGAFICENLKQSQTESVIGHYQIDGEVKHLSFTLTFLFLCAGSDLQSLSMCSPTLISGISPLLMGMGMLHRGHTGTWISYRINELKTSIKLRITLHLRKTGACLTQFKSSNKTSYCLPFCRMTCICDLHK